MSKEEKLRFIEEIMDVEENSLNYDDELTSIDSWDSMSVLGFMTEMRLRFNEIIEVKQIRELITVSDLCALIPDC